MSAGGGLLKTESYRSGIALSVGFSLLAKLIALASSLVLAALFGTSAEMDVYLYVFFAAALVTTFISALNSSVIIPEAMRLFEQRGEAAARGFVNFFLYAYAASGLALAAACLAGPVAVFARVSRFDAGLLAANAGLLYAALPLFPLILVSNYLVEVLASRKFFTVPMLASMFNNAVVLVFVLAAYRRFGVMSALLGLCTAYAAQVLALLLFMRARLGWEFSSAARPSRRVLGNALFAQLGNLATAVSAYVPMFLLSGLDRGTVSAMNYGRQAAEFPHNFITQQFASVAGIKLNELSARGLPGEAARIVVSSMKGLLFVLVPAALFGAAYSGEIIRALFGRGAFGAESVETAAAFFRLFALLLPFYAVNSLVTKLFLAAQKVREAFWFQLAMNLLLAGLIVVFVGRFGALGYPAGLLVFSVLVFLASGALCARYFPEVRYRETAAYFAGLAVLDAGVLLAVHWAFRRLCPGLPLTGAALAAAAYFGLLAWASLRLEVNEDFRRAWELLKGKLSGTLPA